MSRCAAVQILTSISNSWVLIDLHAIYPRIPYINMFEWALQNFAEDFGQTALSIFKGKFCRCPLILEFLETGPDHNTGGYTPLLNPAPSMGFVSSLTAPTNQ